MNVLELIKKLSESHIRLSVKDGELSASGKKGVVSADILQLLKQHKSELIRYLSGSDHIPANIPISDRTLPTPLSFSQQRLWLLDRMDGGSVHYNMPDSLRLLGDLDTDALSKAFDSLIERHESLRTFFVEGEDGQPYQKVSPAKPLIIAVEDLSLMKDVSKQERAKQIVESEKDRPFDLSNDLMLRVGLIKMSSNDHILILTSHHIAFDGWSRSILINELCALYADSKEGRTSALPPLPIQYSDYSSWQRRWLSGEMLESQLVYWEKKLSGLPEIHSLPLDFDRPYKQSFRGDSLSSLISKTDMEELKRCCIDHGATLFMGLHAVLSCVLSLYSNESDIVIGTPTANREQPEVAGLIGFFSNSLILRSDLSGSPSFGELLTQSKNTLLDAYAHQQVPFEKIIERLQPERSLAYSAGYQIVLALQNNEEGSLDLPGVTVDPLDSEDSNRVARNDITLDVSQGESGLSLTWGYNTEIFKEESIRRFSESFNLLLKRFSKEPGRSIFEFHALSDFEKSHLLDDLSAHDDDLVEPLCVYEMFEQRVKENESAVALVYENQELSYGELNRKANRLAHYLTSNFAIGADRIVAICLERSIDMIVSMLAVMKSGAAYLPMDPRYPQARLEAMVHDASPALVIMLSAAKSDVTFNDCSSLCIDDKCTSDAIDQCRDANMDKVQIGLKSHHLAYLIYTSGSTGEPKGVMVEHGNLTRLFNTTDELFRFNQTDVWAMFHSFSFDFSVWEIWGALAHGGKLVIVPYEITRSPNDFYQLLIDEKVTVLNQTPSAFSSLIDVDGVEEGKLSLKHVVFGGEALNFSILQPWIDRHGDLRPRLVNMYGITETTVHSTFKRITQSMLNEAASASVVGHALSDLTILLLNRKQHLTPLGGIGEIYICGPGVARGYLKRPQLTAERFCRLPDFSNERFYRSGDLARITVDGELQYLGREDRQVKVRGFRIELGEIRARIRELDGVKDAEVVLRESAGGDKQLVAYVVPLLDLRPEDIDKTIIDSYLKKLRTKLPDYMVPAAIVVLDKLPLNSSGKLDVKSLPPPGLAAAGDSVILASSPEEKVLASMWCEILFGSIDISQLSIDENFFRLGGNSLLVVKMSSMLREAGYDISVRDIVASPTVESIAVLMQSAEIVKNTETDASRVITAKRVPITNGQQMMLQLNEGFKILLFKELVFETLSEINLEVLGKTVSILLNHHEALRSRFVKSPDGWQAEISAPVESFEVKYEDLSHIPSGADINDMCFDFFRSVRESLHITDGPLFSVAYVKLEDQTPNRICMFIHHLLYDGFSLNIFQEDFKTVFEACSKGVPPNLYTCASVNDVAVWEAQLKKSTEGFPGLREWLMQWKVERIPLDFPIPHSEINKFNTVRSRTTLSKKITINEALGVDFSVVCKIAIVNVFSRVFGMHACAISSVSALRYDISMAAKLDVSRTVGLLSGIKEQVFKPMLNAAVEDRFRDYHIQLSEIPEEGVLRYGNNYYVDDQGKDLITGDIRFNFQEVSAEKNEKFSEPQIFDFYNDSILPKGRDGGPIDVLEESDLDIIWPELFNIDAVLQDDTLMISWGFSKNLYKPETIKFLLDSLIREIHFMLENINDVSSSRVYSPGDKESFELTT